MATQYTVFMQYPYPEFDDRPFIEAYQTFVRMVDDDIGHLTNTTGVVVTAWDNSHSYVINDKVLDTDTLQMYIANVLHTSVGSGSFASDRVAHPTYWTAFGTPLNPRGAWAQSTAYAILDHVYDTGEGVSAICVVAHVSTATGTIRTDVAKWQFIVDILVSLSVPVTGQLILAGQVFGG